MSLNTFSSPLFRAAHMSTKALSGCRWNSTSATVSTSTFTSQRSPNAHGQNVRSLARRRLPNRQKFLEDQKSQGESRVLERFQTREWKAGDIYAPHDLSPAEMKKWRKRYSPSTDAFDALNMNPLDHYKNFSIMSEYMTSMGRIKHSSQTGLRPVNQRKIAKAIRRSIGLGLMPSVHRHPEILAAEAKARMDSGSIA
ncbi:hypothetical protein DTO271G3_2192 [Paecilomyces variotii]|nr:hypothetical protein DTO271G3_2192 [Paecilomyces variotii]